MESGVRRTLRPRGPYHVSTALGGALRTYNLASAMLLKKFKYSGIFLSDLAQNAAISTITAIMQFWSEQIKTTCHADIISRAD